VWRHGADLEARRGTKRCTLDQRGEAVLVDAAEVKPACHALSALQEDALARHLDPRVPGIDEKPRRELGGAGFEGRISPICEHVAPHPDLRGLAVAGQELRARRRHARTALASVANDEESTVTQRHDEARPGVREPRRRRQVDVPVAKTCHVMANGEIVPRIRARAPGEGK
jgi:hypothetical protein